MVYGSYGLFRAHFWCWVSGGDDMGEIEAGLNCLRPGRQLADRKFEVWQLPPRRLSLKQVTASMRASDNGLEFGPGSITIASQSLHLGPQPDESNRRRTDRLPRRAGQATRRSASRAQRKTGNSTV